MGLQKHAVVALVDILSPGCWQAMASPWLGSLHKAGSGWLCPAAARHVMLYFSSCGPLLLLFAVLSC